MKLCKNEDCKIVLNAENTYIDRKFLQAYCKKCKNKIRVKQNKIRQLDPVIKKEALAKARARRKNPKNIHKMILWDSKYSDKKYNRENDLTKEFVKNKINCPCFYCGETKLRMTLDRIDNSLRSFAK